MKKIYLILLFLSVAFGCKDRSGAVGTPLKDQVQNSAEYRALRNATIALMNAKLDNSIKFDYSKKAQLDAGLAKAKSLEDTKKVFKDANVIGYDKLAELMNNQNHAIFNLAKKFPELKKLSSEERKAILDLKLETDPVLRKQYTDSLLRSQL